MSGAVLGAEKRGKGKDSKILCLHGAYVLAKVE